MGKSVVFAIDFISEAVLRKSLSTAFYASGGKLAGRGRSPRFAGFPVRSIQNRVKGGSVPEVKKESVTYEEYNERRAKTITALKAKLRVRAPDKETGGNWYQWFKSREKVRRTCETLFAEFDQERSPLDIRNRAAIVEIRWTLYPLLLGDLAKCYEQMRHF